jgi:hypothetical protein
MDELKYIIEKNRHFIQNLQLSKGKYHNLLKRFEAIEENVKNIIDNITLDNKTKIETLQKLQELVINKIIIPAPLEYIYVLTNEAFPKYIKIGMTQRHPVDRLSEINGETGVPSPFKLAFYSRCYNSIQIEKQVHKEFDKYRIHNRKEFFEINLDVAVKLIVNVCEKEFQNINSAETINRILQSYLPYSSSK